ncbi:MAG: DUF4276 family protein [Burkholderiales bacterium]
MNTIEVIVFAEGPSDEQFVKRVVAPRLHPQHIFLKPRTLRTSREASGGAINFDRLKFNVRNTVRQNPRTYLTTFFDLYALDNGMPGKAAAAHLATPSSKATHIQNELHAALVAHADCRPERLLPYVQPYELEGLFFSDLEQLASVERDWAQYLPALKAVRSAFDTPEHINDGYATKPSSRLESMLAPRYRKTRHAPLIGESIGLNRIVHECPHFAAWIARLQALQPL